MSFFLSFSPLTSPFLARWRRSFADRSSTARVEIERLRRAFRDGAGRRSFEFWRAIADGFASDDASESPTFDDEAETDDDAEAQTSSFLLQTFAAQTFFSILSIVFELSDAELFALFGATPFDWGRAIRANLAPRATELAPDAAREFAPFGECYSRLFPARRRRTLGEFYTPSVLADYLRDRALDFFADGATETGAFPSILDPTCGGGVFLTSALARRLERGDDAATALNDLAGFDASPFAVATARANLMFAATANVPPPERPAALRAIVRKRREERPNEPIFPVFLLDSVENRVPTGPSGRRDPPNGTNLFSEFVDFNVNAVSERAETAPDYFDSRRWERSADFSRRFDVALGNPPWIAWDKLSPRRRDATKKYWLEYGLFSLSGKEARLGGGKKELASLLVAATIDRRLAPRGILAFVLPKSLFQTRKAGDGFRRFGWRTTEFRVLQLDDFSEIDVFSNVSSKVATFCVRKGETTRFPLPARRWRSVETQKIGGAWKIVARAEPGFATPISSAPGAPLRIESEIAPNADARQARLEIGRRVSDADALVERILAANAEKKTSDYVARLGANAAGAGGVFWLERVESLAEPTVAIRNLGDVGRKKVPIVDAEVESALVFPLLRWRDVDEFAVREPSTAILLPQNPQTRRGIDDETMRRDFPAARAYLAQFENALRNRAAYQKFQHRAPFWSLYNVDVATFAPIKVVWRRMDAFLRAAVVEFDSALNRPTIPQETLATVAVDSLDEADYLAALLNSNPIRSRVAATSVSGAKSFGTPGILETLGVPRFDSNDADRRALAELGREARLQKTAARTKNARPIAEAFDRALPKGGGGNERAD